MPDIVSTVWPNEKRHIDDMFTVSCALQTHLTLTTLHVLRLPLTQKHVPSFLRKDYGPFRLVLCVDHEVVLLCLPLDS